MTNAEFKALFLSMVQEISGPDLGTDSDFGSEDHTPWPKTVDDGPEGKFIFLGGCDASPFYTLEKDAASDSLVQIPLRVNGKNVDKLYGYFSSITVVAKAVGPKNKDGLAKALRLRFKGLSGASYALQIGCGTFSGDSLLRSLQLLASRGQLAVGSQITLEVERGTDAKAIFVRLFADQGEGKLMPVWTKDTEYDYIAGEPDRSATQQFRVIAINDSLSGTSTEAYTCSPVPDEF